MVEPTFGERLTSWLKFLGMRQADLARALSVSKAAVHGWTTNASPTTDRIVPICEALGVSVAEFFSRMPAEDAPMQAERERQIAEAEKLDAHPFTGEVTRELDRAAIDRALGQSETCPTCGRHGEAA